MKNLCILFVVSFLFSCSNAREYWDLSQFNIVEDALKEGEEFKVLYYLAIAQSDNPEKAYNHYIVVSEKTGDTVNILSSGASIIKGPDEIYSFSGKYENIIEAAMDLSNKQETITNGSIEELVNQNTKNSPSDRKVLRDPKNDDLAKNNWPTVFGSPAKVTPAKE